MHETKATDHRLGKRGSILVYLIMTLVVFGVLAAASVSMYSSSQQTAARPNCASQARIMAESGIRYALARLRNCADESAVTTAVSEMNGKTYVIDDGKGMSFTLAVSYASGAATVNSTGTSCDIFEPATASLGSMTFSLPAATSGSTPGGGETASLGGTYGTAIAVAGSVIGDVITESFTIQGGSIVTGSLTYLGTSSCLSLAGGATVGTAGESNTVCSATCVNVTGGATVNGDLNAQGDVKVSATVNGDIRSAGKVTISNGRVNGSIYAQDSVSITGTVTGDVYSGGNVSIGWGGAVHGDIFCSGTATSPGGFLGAVTTGYDKANIELPATCQGYELPAHRNVVSTKSLVISGQKTFTGVSNLNDTTNAYTSISSSSWPSVCFDLSTPGTYINIFCSGNMSFSGELYVRTSPSVACFAASNKVTNTDFAAYAAASRVYMDVQGSVTFGGGVSWFGTVYAGGDIKPGGGGAYIGGLYTNQSLNPSHQWFTTRFVASDYVSAYWQ